MTPTLAILTAATLFGIAGALAKALFHADISPLALTAIRTLLSCALFAGVILAVPRLSFRIKRDALPLLVAAGLAFTAVNVTFYLAISLISVAGAITLEYTAPFFLFLFWRSSPAAGALASLMWLSSRCACSRPRKRGYTCGMNARVHRQPHRRGGRQRRRGDWRALEQVLAALPLAARAERPAGDDAQRRLADFWARRFGDVAGRSEPLLFASGRLVVFVESAVWGQEIRHRAPGLLEELAQSGIDAASVTVKTRPPPPPPPPPRKTRPRFRLSAASAARIDALADNVSHPPLAEALRRLVQKAGGG